MHKREYLLTPKAQFHVAVRTHINKSVVYFTVRRNVKFWCSKNANLCTKFDVKSGLSDENYVRCQSLYVYKRLVLLPLFQLSGKIRHGSMNFRVAKFQGLRYSLKMLKYLAF